MKGVGTICRWEMNHATVFLGSGVVDHSPLGPPAREREGEKEA